VVRPYNAVVYAPEVTKRIIRNPNYGGPRLSYQGWCSQPVTPATRKVQFFDALRESVAAEGFRNPIILWNVAEGLHVQFGVSRLRVAQEMDMMIPAIINDVTGDMHGNYPEVTPENWRDFFTDVPAYHKFNNDGSFDYHYSLERNRRHSYDPQGMEWADDGAQFIKDEFPWLS
jgi:hypothetical protein